MRSALPRVVGSIVAHRAWARGSTLLWGLLEFVALQRARRAARQSQRTL